MNGQGLPPGLPLLTPEEMEAELEKHRERMAQLGDALSARSFRAQMGTQVAAIELLNRDGKRLRRVPPDARGGG